MGGKSERNLFVDVFACGCCSSLIMALPPKPCKFCAAQVPDSTDGYQRLARCGRILLSSFLHLSALKRSKQKGFMGGMERNKLVDQSSFWYGIPGDAVGREVAVV